jgi:hypothetical protein
MCECGCTYGNAMYTLPGPDGSVYVLVFQPACRDCDGPDAVIVQKWPSRTALEKIECEHVPVLPMIHCDAGWEEAVITTGRTEGEFIKALRDHLVGVSSKEIMGGDDERLDVDAADVILEEMYESATFTPRLAGTGTTGGDK